MHFRVVRFALDRSCSDRPVASVRSWTHLVRDCRRSSLSMLMPGAAVVVLAGRSGAGSRRAGRVILLSSASFQAALAGSAVDGRKSEEIAARREGPRRRSSGERWTDQSGTVPSSRNFAVLPSGTRPRSSRTWSHSTGTNGSAQASGRSGRQPSCRLPNTPSSLMPAMVRIRCPRCAPAR
jgi:hypothetical protein